MEVAAGDGVLTGEKLIQSIDSERVTSSFPDENLTVVESNYAHYTPHDTSQISLNNDTKSCVPHYTSQAISTENNSNDVVSTGPTEVQQEYEFQQEKTSEQYASENDISSENQNVSDVKVDTSEYVLENQTENIFLSGQEENNVVNEEAATEEIVIQQSEPSAEHYLDTMNDNFESQYVSEVQDTSAVVGEVDAGTESRVKNLEDKIEEVVEEVPEAVVNKNVEIENEQPAVEIIQTTGLEEPYIEKGNIKIESSVSEVIQEQVIIEETVHEISEPASSVDDSMEIQTSSEIEESFVDRRDDIEMTSSQIVEGEDGTILTVETYRTLDISKDPENPPKTVVEVAPPKVRKTRKPQFDVPMHVLGVDISKPNESVPNGRPSPKPRLGVKVPYRNLTSQIVSKAEIEEEIMERSRQKQKANVEFARSLTQRLAKKIAPPTETISVIEQNTMSLEEEEAAADDPLQMDSKEVATTVESNTIENDSDLLAILEGDGEDMPVLPKEVQTVQEDDTNLKALEREIALQQLQELPSQEPKPRIFRSRQTKAALSESPIKAKSAVLEKTPLKLLQEKSDKNKENSSKQSTSHSHAQSPEKKDPYNIDAAVSPKKMPIDVEPQVKVNMVLKTYSRKRKISENKESPDKTPPPKKPTFDDPDVKIDIDAPSPTAEVYVTKSSRIIKKKVIWDPAEAQPRTLKTITKSVEVKTPPAIKSVKTEKISSQEKNPEKRVEKSVVKKDKSFPEKKVRNESPKTNKSPPKSKKPRSEIDKLLMDEGAVKMLYELNNEEPSGKKKKDFYSVDRAERDILKKANQLKNELQQNSDIGPLKSLRKKESFTPSPVKPAATVERKMSKDSTLSSVQNTPPGSPFPHSQGSMLIRRRSSSSISSSDNNLEMDELVGKIAKRKSEGSKSKKAKKSTSNIKPDVKDKTEKIESPVKVSKTNQFKAFTVKRIGKSINIDLNYIDEKCYFSIQVLEELTSALKRFSKDRECLVVTLSSSSKAFCLGLDYASLVSDNEDERKEGAKCMTDKVRDFLMCLLQFPKILIASIQGDCVGLGVTMLPLFDMVVASDKATFSTPYSKLGCMSEAGFLLSFPNFTNHGLAAELLYTGQTLTADDAYRRGLVTRLCWPEKYNDTLKNIVVSISQGSKQSLESTKKQLRNHTAKQAEEAINTDMKTLIDHWTSAECQKNFSQMESLI